MEQRLIPYEAVTSLGHGPVLVLAPHPDDEVFGCGGAILTHVAAGDAIRVIVLTDGVYGVEGEASIAAHRQVREQESRRAATLLGYGEPVFWQMPDRGLRYGEQLVTRIAEEMKIFGADLVYAPSVMEAHPDHRALGMAAVEAVRRSEPAVQLAMYEVGVPLRPNRLLNITAHMDRKRRAMACFESQLRNQAYDEHITALNRFRTYTLPKSVTAAEAYYVTTAKELQSDPLGLYSSGKDQQISPGPGTDIGTQPLVSVIIRSINRPQLREALRSVALQTYRNIEVIVVNATGPGHVSIGNYCGDFPLRVYGGEQPLSRTRAANLGLENATGSYLCFLDDDDIFYPDHVAGLVNALQEHPVAKAVYAGIREETVYKDGSQGPVVIRNSPFDADKLCAENHIPMHAVLFNSSLRNLGVRFDETLERYEDWDFWLQILQHTEFLHVDRITGCYRNGGSCGFGVEPDRELEDRSKEVFFKKWRQRWSKEQAARIIDASGDAKVMELLGPELADDSAEGDSKNAVKYGSQ